MRSIVRAVGTEAVRAGGRRSPWWFVAVPLGIGVPLLMTYVVAAVFEKLATMNTGEVGVTPVEPNNSITRVIDVGVLIFAVGAAHAHGSAVRGPAAETERFLFRSPSTMILARSLYYGAIAAAAVLGMTVLLLTTLPHLFPVVYGKVGLLTGAGLRFCWAVPVFAFCAAVLGIGLAAVTRSSVAAIALMLLWAGFLENAIALVPGGMKVQQFMPFLNGIYGTGQWLALTPPWGCNGALAYFALCAALILAVGIAATIVRRRRN